MGSSSNLAISFDVPTVEQVTEIFPDHKAILDGSRSIVDFATSESGLHVGVVKSDTDSTMSWPPEVCFTADSTSAYAKAHSRAMSLALREGVVVLGQVLEDEAASRTAGNFFEAVLEACEADFSEEDAQTLKDNIKLMKGND